MSTTQDEPLCSAREGACVCVKERNHEASGDEVHSCDPDICTGQWIGDYSSGCLDEETFKIVRLPLPGPKNPIYNRIT